MPRELKIRKRKSPFYFLCWLVFATIMEELFGIGEIIVFLVLVLSSWGVVARFRDKNCEEYEVYE